jgi:hypothetical protein
LITPNPIDLTTLAAVKQWANVGVTPNQSAAVPASSPYAIQTNAQSNIGVSYAGGASLTEVESAPSRGQYTFANGLYTFAAADANASVVLNFIASTNDDQQIQDCITAFSAYVLKLTGRGPMDGSMPTESPFVQPVAYDDFYDGSGTMRQQVRNWPITAVTSVTVNGIAIPQSTSVQVPGWVVDGDKKFITLRGGYSPNVATFQNYRNQGVGLGYGPGFAYGPQNVEIVYTAGFSGVPDDLEMAARKVVALNYVRRGWIGQRSQAMAAGGGTVTYGTWEMDADCKETIMYYRRQTG